MSQSELSMAQATEHRRLMAGMRVVHLDITARAADTLFFGEQPGSALRGALYETLAAKFCGTGYDEATPDHRAVCPVCRLLAAEDEQSGRGRNVPRPLTIEPPFGATHIAAGTNFRFGISLIGWAESVLLYVLRAVELLGSKGIGRGRGRFFITAVKEISPLDGSERPLLDRRVVHQPQLAVTVAAIENTIACRHAKESVSLELLTPMRLTCEGRLVKQLNAEVLMQRLIERCQSLAEHYAVSPDPAVTDATSATREDWLQLYHELGNAARNVEVIGDETCWVEARSGSRRQQRYTEIGGLVGSVVLEGQIAPLLPWLLWGQSLHVGKDAVKGNGWYRLR